MSCRVHGDWPCTNHDHWCKWITSQNTQPCDCGIHQRHEEHLVFWKEIYAGSGPSGSTAFLYQCRPCKEIFQKMEVSHDCGPSPYNWVPA